MGRGEGEDVVRREVCVVKVVRGKGDVAIMSFPPIFHFTVVWEEEYITAPSLPPHPTPFFAKREKTASLFRFQSPPLFFFFSLTFFSTGTPLYFTHIFLNL